MALRYQQQQLWLFYTNSNSYGSSMQTTALLHQQQQLPLFYTNSNSYGSSIPKTATALVYQQQQLRLFYTNNIYCSSIPTTAMAVGGIYRQLWLSVVLI